MYGDSPHKFASSWNMVPDFSLVRAKPLPILLALILKFIIGEEFIDQVALSDDLTNPQQSIGVAEFAIGFDTVDGILG